MMMDVDLREIFALVPVVYGPDLVSRGMLWTEGIEVQILPAHACTEVDFHVSFESISNRWTR